MSVPKESPEVKNLNSYYLHIQKLIEHYQGEFGAGCVHFKSTDSEGTLFFDQDEIIPGSFHQNGTTVQTHLSVEKLIQMVSAHNYAVDIYRIEPDEVYFWVGVAKAQKLYENLSTEFTNLDALIKKMSAEKLTGYIEVVIGKGDKSGIIFLHSGNIVGGSYSWNRSGSHKDNIKGLIRETIKSGGVFHVGRIMPEAPEKTKRSERPPLETGVEVLKILESFLQITERVISSNKKLKVEFSTLLKKKFIQKADRYAFLDPFAAEFKYANGSVAFTGEAEDVELLRGVIEAVRELAEEIGVFPLLTESLAPWFRKFEKTLKRYGIQL